MRFIPNQVPLKIPHSSTACTKYLEQLGSNRQLLPNNGEIAH